MVKRGLVLSIPPLPLSQVTDREVQKVWSLLLQESCRKYTFKLQTGRVENTEILTGFKKNNNKAARERGTEEKKDMWREHMGEMND